MAKMFYSRLECDIYLISLRDQESIFEFEISEIKNAIYIWNNIFFSVKCKNFWKKQTFLEIYSRIEFVQSDTVFVWILHWLCSLILKIGKPDVTELALPV